MSEVDYKSVDEELDDELRALYPDSNAKDQANEINASPSSEGTEASETTPDEGTVVDEKETIEPESEDTVSAERYKNAVIAMNAAQQEAAENRKELAQVRNYEAERNAYVAQLEHQLTTLQTNTSSTPTGEPDDEDLADARDNFPEIINPLLKKIDRLEKQLDSMSNDVGNVKTVTNRIQKTEQDTEAERHFAAIRAQHDDLDEIVESPEYTQWYNQQGPMIQQILQQGTAADVIAALNLYRNDHPRSTSPQPRKVNGNSKLEAARNASSPNVKIASKPDSKIVFTMAQVEKMSDAEFSEHEAEIDRQLARGELY